MKTFRRHTILMVIIAMVALQLHADDTPDPAWLIAAVQQLLIDTGVIPDPCDGFCSFVDGTVNCSQFAYGS